MLTLFLLPSLVRASEADITAKPEGSAVNGVETQFSGQAQSLGLQTTNPFPLHAQVDFNNQGAPNTPHLRINASATYNNLWNLDHSIGVQYCCSPEDFKGGESLDFYDRPLIANYGTFYRLPLSPFDKADDKATVKPGSFGYDEATRRFRLPSSSDHAELTVYASRSSSDTGVNESNFRTILNNPGVLVVTEHEDQQDLSVNESAGFRLSNPLISSSGLHSYISGGADVKSYDFTSSRTNVFGSIFKIIDQNGTATTSSSTVPSALPTIHRTLDYLPLTIRYDGHLEDGFGTTWAGLGLGGNVWYSGSESALRTLASSEQSSGYWVTVNPSLARDVCFFTNWPASFRADGQWSSEPLISNEQLGLGGLNTVRGYREGEVLGDTGWHVSVEQGTPRYTVCKICHNLPLALRGTMFMDYGEAYLLDPQVGKGRTELWGAGFGGVFTIGALTEAQLLLSWPLLSAGFAQAGDPRLDFSLSARF